MVEAPSGLLAGAVTGRWCAGSWVLGPRALLVFGGGIRLCPGQVSAITCSSVGLILAEVQGCNRTHSHTHTCTDFFFF